MTRVLNKSVLAGGVVYPAGTPATPELEALINRSVHWQGEPDPAPLDESVPQTAAADTAGTKATENPAVEVDTKTDKPVTQEAPQLDETAGQEPAEKPAPVDTPQNTPAGVPVDTEPPAKVAAPVRKAPAKKTAKKAAKKAPAKKAAAKKATGS